LVLLQEPVDASHRGCVKNGLVMHINANLCCYISLWSQHSTYFKSASSFLVSVSVDYTSVRLKQYISSIYWKSAIS